MFGYGGKLAPADRVVRAVIGLMLIIWGPLGGWAPAAIALGAATGGFMLAEATLNYCPLARFWPWNRAVK